MVSCLIFKSLNHFEFIFVCGIRMFSHVAVWQKSTQDCKAIILQLKINKLGKIIRLFVWLYGVLVAAC